MAAPVYTGGLPFIKGGVRTKYKIISPATATLQLNRSNSNSVCLFNAASGVTFTLPAAVPGLIFQFAVTVSVTSNSHKVITKNTGSEFLIGELEVFNTVSSDAQTQFHGDGAANVAVTQAASGSNATGGLQGSFIQFICLTTGLWTVQGQCLAGTSGTSPFANS